MPGIIFHDGTRGLGVATSNLVGLLRGPGPLPSASPLCSSNFIHFYAGHLPELRFFDMCARIPTFAYFDILQLQQLWAKHLQAMTGFILQAAKMLAKSSIFPHPTCEAFQNAQFSFLVFLTVLTLFQKICLANLDVMLEHCFVFLPPFWV